MQGVYRVHMYISRGSAVENVENLPALFRRLAELRLGRLSFPLCVFAVADDVLQVDPHVAHGTEHRRLEALGAYLYVQAEVCELRLCGSGGFQGWGKKYRRSVPKTCSNVSQYVCTSRY